MLLLEGDGGDNKESVELLSKSLEKINQLK